MQASLGLGVEPVGMGFEVRDQGGTMCLALVGLTQAVELELDVPALDQPELAPERTQHQDQFGVHVRPGVPERLDVELVELARAPLLRPLVAEHRAQLPDAQWAVVERVVFVDGAHDAGGGLGPQCQAIAVHRVFPGEHLLFDDVGDLAQAAHEQRRRFDDRRAQVAIAPAREQVAGLALDPFPACRLVGQHVVHAFDGSDAFSHLTVESGVAGLNQCETAPAPKRFSM